MIELRICSVTQNKILYLIPKQWRGFIEGKDSTVIHKHLNNTFFLYPKTGLMRMA
jgi:hypothetical protein